jgi:hypothetical protein
MEVELLHPAWLEGNTNSEKLVAAAATGLAVAGYRVKRCARPSWRAPRIVVWGLGHPRGQELVREARACGVTVVGFDVGYWMRGGPRARFRVTVNDAHPQARVMARKRPLSRLTEDGVCLREDGSERGPLILVGMGQKSAATYGEAPGAWEVRTLAKIRQALPGRRVLFRPKGPGHAHLRGVEVLWPGAIERALAGAALVYCRHSNVAVDAIIAGVPAIAEGGAAAAVCEHDLAPGRLPPALPREKRMEFLGNLAWFQWSLPELTGPQAWQVIEDIVRSAA